MDSVEIDETVVLHNGLVERSFGRLDNEKIYTYAYVWPLDKFNVTHTAFDVESVAAVCTRLRALVLELEAAYDNHHIVLVSHADVLQIAQLYAAEVPNVGYFSSYRFASKYHNTHSSTVLQCRRMIWSSCGGWSECYDTGAKSRAVPHGIYGVVDY